jgi:regulator of cell morphogenesis and NO signaling
MATATQSIREIIASQPTAAAILQRFDIDVCAHAGESLREACTDLQLSIEQVLEKLEQGAAIESGAEYSDPREFAPSRLIQHIVRVHHQNVRHELPRLVEMAHTVAREHGERAPALRHVELIVDELRADMAEHLHKEEQVLFPYIAQADEAPLPGFRPPQQPFSRVGQPVFMMVQEHERARLLLAELGQVTNEFTPPDWACATFHALYAGLKTFAANLEEHIRLENDVLFPRAIAMEAAQMQAGAQ